MTEDRRDGEDTPYGNWLRHHPELDSRFGYDAENIDYVWHQYVDGNLLLKEEKRYNRSQSYPQQDTHSIIDQALQFAFSHPDFVVKRKNPKRPNKINYCGYHLIQFEHNTPDDGGIRIDGVSVTKEQYIRFLKFDKKIMQWLELKRLNKATNTMLNRIEETKNKKEEKQFYAGMTLDELLDWVEDAEDNLL